MQALQEMIGAQEADLVASATDRMAEGVRQESLADADRAEEGVVLVAFDEAEGEEIADTVAVEGDRRVPIEAFEGLFLVEAAHGAERR